MSRCLMGEVGYTPQNLADLLYDSGMSQQEAADICGIAIQNFRRYLQPIGTDSHSSMPAIRWAKLYAEYQKRMAE